MSRLTASPFHKPTAFSYPRAPVSPPETNSEFIAPASVTVAGGHMDLDVESAVTESPAARFRRVSTLAYNASGLRGDPRERDRRSYKTFVVVLPPPSLQDHHGRLGHTLAQGPHHRLSQGLLMPLFPTVRCLCSVNLILNESS